MTNLTHLSFKRTHRRPVANRERPDVARSSAAFRRLREPLTMARPTGRVSWIVVAWTAAIEGLYVLGLFIAVLLGSLAVGITILAAFVLANVVRNLLYRKS